MTFGNWLVSARCRGGHTQKLTIGPCTKEWAESLAGLLDGTHPLYVTSPRDDANSQIAHCLTCGSLVDCTVTPDPSPSN
jgi:hypothetical protein